MIFSLFPFKNRITFFEANLTSMFSKIVKFTDFSDFIEKLQLFEK